MEDLRAQVIEEEGEYEEGAGPLPQFLARLKPWQRLVLAALLFFNVALLGCMALVMAGRVAFPF